MSEADPERAAEPTAEPAVDPTDTAATETSRLHLLWDVIVFQFKLAADGLRDILLSPLSIFSALLGLISGGDDPYRYFRQVLKFGRRTEIWINLFGYRKHSGTSDEFIAPIKDRVMSEARSNPWLSKAGKGLNRKLDDVNSELGRKSRRMPPDDSG